MHGYPHGASFRDRGAVRERFYQISPRHDKASANVKNFAAKSNGFFMEYNKFFLPR